MGQYKHILYILLISIIIPNDLEFGNLPIQQHGRIKPIDTFARNHLLAIYTKTTLKGSALPHQINKNKLSASNWLLDLLLYPNEADKYKIFNIRNPEIVGSLGLSWDPTHLFNRNEILTGLQNQLEYITKIQNIAEKDLTVFDRDMLNLYSNVINFQKLCFSLSCLLPLIPIEDEIIARALNVNVFEKISYYEILKKQQDIGPLIKQLINKNKNSWTKSDRALGSIIHTINNISQDEFANLLKIIPPSMDNKEAIWLSPWELMDGRKISTEQQIFLDYLSSYIKSKYDNKFDNSLNQYYDRLKQYNKLFSIKLIEYEKWYNDIDLFTKSISLYIISFFLLAFSWMYKPNLFRMISSMMLLVGWLIHCYGIYLRMIIMQRPPVSTLYESIIFVNLIGVTCCLLLEYKRRDGLGILVGTICGIMLHFVGFGYANDGDTLGMLVAVLNSNFWLATHVTTITTGYGTSLFAGLLGHIYLIQQFIFPDNKKYLKNLYSNMYGATLFALFFTLFGTILGGIWADQSWGRFWGWDPKENGALLIVMWQIMIIHMRMVGYIKPIGFAFGMVLNNIIVVLAWFGVNLLSVGLHSYGFSSGIAKNLFIFILIELIFAFGFYFLAKSDLLKNKSIN